MLFKAYKYRLYPNTEQQELLAQHFGCARFVYNIALSMKDKFYKQNDKGLSKRAVQDQFVALKKTDEFSWLNNINSQSILASLGHIDTAYNNFFKGRAKFPKYKSRKSNWQSFQAPQHVQVDFELGMIKLPKIGWIKSKLHRNFKGEVKTCTIKRDPSGRYFISVLVETEESLPVKSAIKEDTTRGLDLGIKDFGIFCNAEKISNPRFLQHQLKTLKKEQKIFSRCKKGSERYSKQKKKVAKCHAVVTNQRNNFLHQTSAELLRDSQTETVAVEDLHVKGMIRNHKLARHIADVSWSGFIDLLKYKTDWLGKNLIFCDRFAPSSKTCSCGHKNNSLTLADRHWTCSECGESHDRDVLAANNIKKFALADVLGMKVGDVSPHVLV